MVPKKSPVWQFFQQINKDVASCSVCGKEIRYNSSPTNLKDHIRRKHGELSEYLTDTHYNESDKAKKSKKRITSSGDSIFIASPYPDEGTSALSTVDASQLGIGENKEVINYQKLVVPMSMRSVYWKCFGFPADAEGEILTKAKIVCLLCKMVISYNRNTSNLRLHLQNRHAGELAELELSSTPRKSSDGKVSKKYVKQKPVCNVIYSSNTDATLDESDSQANESRISAASIMESQYVQIGNSEGDNAQSTSKKERKDVKPRLTLVAPGENNQICTIESLHPFMIPVDNKSVCDAIADFIVMDLQSPDIVEGRGFQRLIATLKSPCEIPSRLKLVDEVIPTSYDKYKSSFIEQLKKMTTDIALTVEEWQAANEETYVTFSVCYQQVNDFNLQSKVLSTVHCPPSADISFWNLTFENLLEEWHIKEDKVKAVVSGSNRSDLLSALATKGLVVLPCLVQTLQEVCTRVCFEQDDVKEVLEKCRACIYLIYKNNSALTALRIQDHLMSLEESPLTSDYPRVWISTYLMLENFSSRRQFISSVLDNIEPHTYDRDLVTLTESDWTLIDDILSVLEPFKVTVMTLSEEKAPLVSLIKPLLWQLLSCHLKEKPEDSMNAQVFKAALKTILSEKYNEVAVERLLQTASTLDPRFKNLPNVAEESKVALGGHIKEALTELIEKTPEDAKPKEEGSEKKKPRLSGMMILLGGETASSSSSSEMTALERAKLEIVQYQSEQTLGLDQCPVTWWGHSTNRCPNLARLAAQYQCIPATSVPAVRVPVEAQVAFDQKRANLLPEIVDRLIFLNSNH